jgi:hypothetical protein
VLAEPWLSTALTLIAQVVSHLHLEAGLQHPTYELSKPLLPMSSTPSRRAGATSPLAHARLAGSPPLTRANLRPAGSAATGRSKQPLVML